MNILILGSGGREYTIAWAIRKSTLCDQLYIAPGNAGTESIGDNLPIRVDDFAAIKKAIIDYTIQCVIVGPELPLVMGIVDELEADFPDVIVIGPSKEAAQLEGSKSYAKAFMQEFSIPTADYIEISAHNIAEGVARIKQTQGPIVLKADGLAAGKGVLILNNHTEAINSLQEMLNGKFGSASEKVVIESFLAGIEFSVFVYTDGANYRILPAAKDYKRIGEGDTGLNTGGMGAVSPVPFLHDELMEKVEERIIKPTITGIKQRGLKYRGFIFFGLINVEGDPYVIEYNCRLGDPETEVVLPRLKNDLMEWFTNPDWFQQPVEVSDETATTVMLVSGGYPQTYQKGYPINQIPGNRADLLVIHAGTSMQEGQIVTNGGRVLAITGLASSRKKALAKSYEVAEQIQFQDKYYRNDIGFDL